MHDCVMPQVKLALSRRLCGLLIGHKGQTVRDFINDSGSTIRVQSLSELTPSDPERTITVSGARDQVLRAIALVLNTVRWAGRRGDVGLSSLALIRAETQSVCIGRATSQLNT